MPLLRFRYGARHSLVAELVRLHRDTIELVDAWLTATDVLAIPGVMIPALPECQDERDDNPRSQLRAPRAAAARTHSGCHADVASHRSDAGAGAPSDRHEHRQRRGSYNGAIKPRQCYASILWARRPLTRTRSRLCASMTRAMRIRIHSRSTFFYHRHSGFSVYFPHQNCQDHVAIGILQYLGNEYALPLQVRSVFIVNLCGPEGRDQLPRDRRASAQFRSRPQ